MELVASPLGRRGMKQEVSLLQNGVSGVSIGWG